MKVRIVGSTVDPYTWEVLRIDRVINIKSVDSAKAYAKQHYNRWILSFAEKVNENTVTPNKGIN